MNSVPLDLAEFVDVGRVGRAELVDRLRTVCAENALLRPEYRRLHDNLTATQTRCTELLEENRRLRAGTQGPTPSEGFNGPAGPGSEGVGLLRQWPWLPQRSAASLDPFDPLVGTADPQADAR